jgi:hypothetical protein
VGEQDFIVSVNMGREGKKEDSQAIKVTIRIRPKKPNETESAWTVSDTPEGTKQLTAEVCAASITSLPWSSSRRDTGLLPAFCTPPCISLVHPSPSAAAVAPQGGSFGVFVTSAASPW